MGFTAWSDQHYHDRAAHLQAAGKSAFGYDDDIRAQRVAAEVNPLMDPAKIKNGARESRDSDTHPHSSAVSVLLDVTGSMREVPRILQDNLCTLFDLLLNRGYLEDPAILVGGIGDATCDRAPLQVGQFESGNEIEDDLSRLFLEGGGGGQQTESYELALYFLARKTSLDCYEKRGRKGYAFLIGDELPYKRVKRREVEHVFGDTLQADIPLRDIVAEVQEKYELFYVLPNLTSYYSDRKVHRCWRDLVGQNFLRLDTPSGISELIAATIGLGEHAVQWSQLSSELHASGANRRVGKAVSTALKHLKPGSLQGTGLTTF